MLDDVTLALLGDRAAQERITARGELLPCAHCGGTQIIEASDMGSVWFFCCSGKCYSNGPSARSEHGARLAWNTRAPILSAEELERLRKDGNENEN